MEAELRKHVGEPTDNLHTLIGKLGNKVSTPLWKSLTVLRDTGNRALHGGGEGAVELLLDDSDADLAPFLLSAVNHLVDELVARPQRSDSLYEMLPEGVKESAQRVRETLSEPKNTED